MILGLTGGLGCGKSTAARMFEAFGYTRLDADQLVRDEILAEPAVAAALAQQFGPQVLTPEGVVHRPAVAKIVFSDDASLAWLENVVHPRLYAVLRARLAADTTADWVVEIPLLFEKQLANWFDFTVCVATSSALQFARLAERGLPPALAEQRISKQLPLAQKLELADFVLLNDGSPDFLRDQIARLVAQLRESR